jgi:hypothetical protein
MGEPLALDSWVHHADRVRRWLWCGRGEYSEPLFARSGRFEHREDLAAVSYRCAVASVSTRGGGHRHAVEGAVAERVAGCTCCSYR